jgi:hypothetical protein
MADPRQEWKTRTGVNEFRKRPSRSPALTYGQTPKRPLATTQQETTAPHPKNVGGPPASRTREQQVEPPQLGRSMSTGLDDYDINWLNGGQQQELQQNGSVYLFGQHWIADPTNPEKLTPRGY